MAATIEINGTLEIDSGRGVIYFHDNHGRTVLRICSLPTPIPDPRYAKGAVVPDKRLGQPAGLGPLLRRWCDGPNITHMFGVSWGR